MRIKPTERVIFQNNPLAEVVCQIRFDPLPIDEAMMLQFNTASAAMGFPVSSFEQVAQVQFGFSINGEGAKATQQHLTPLRVYHQSSTNGEWRVSHCVDFVALTCTRYSTWQEFEANLLKVLDCYREKVGVGNSIRVGLRYRDIVDRQNLGIDGTAWSELLQPFLLGPLAAHEISDQAIPEEDVMSFSFQSNIRLEDCKLLFQGGLVQSIEGSKTAFMIDSDFYIEGDEAVGCMAEPELLRRALNALHKNAGALFAHSMKRKLRNALKPHSPD